VIFAVLRDELYINNTLVYTLSYRSAIELCNITNKMCLGLIQSRRTWLSSFTHLRKKAHNWPKVGNTEIWRPEEWIQSLY